jgi:hypothetical protein
MGNSNILERGSKQLAMDEIYRLVGSCPMADVTLVNLGWADGRRLSNGKNWPPTTKIGGSGPATIAQLLKILTVIEGRVGRVSNYKFKNALPQSVS